jgi:hypothetical protein
MKNGSGNAVRSAVWILPKPRLAMPTVNNSVEECQLIFSAIAVPSLEAVEVTDRQAPQRKQDTTQYIIYNIFV